MPETYTVCTDCGRKIPWSQPRVVQWIMRGTDTISRSNLCVECASK